MGKRKSYVVSGVDPDLDKKDVKRLELGDDAQLPSGAAALDALEEGDKTASSKDDSPVSSGKAWRKIKHAPGKKYLKAASRIEPGREYPLAQAIALVKETAITSFDSSVEAHFSLGIDPTDQDQRVRATVSLPHGTGKAVRVLIFADGDVPGADLQGDEHLIKNLSSGAVKPGEGFDAVVATPSWMPKLAKLGPVLGPVGLLPSLKAGTVTEEPEKVVSDLKKGKIELRCEQKAPVLHTVIGKVSFSEEALAENFQAVLEALHAARPAKVRRQNYIKRITITSTMGPGIRVAAV